MSRSTYIYLVKDAGEIIGASTVKYEAVDFIGDRDFELFRVKDGCRSLPVRIKVKSD